MEAMPFNEDSLTPVSESTVLSAFSEGEPLDFELEDEEPTRRGPGRPRGTNNRRLHALEALFEDPNVMPSGRRHTATAAASRITTGMGNTDFHRACQYGQLGLMRTMLRKGEVDVNCHDSGLNTPLHEAVLHNQEEAVKFLLKSGADAVAENLLREKPITLSRSPEITQILNDFTAYGNAGRKYPFLWACWRGIIKDIRAGAGKADGVVDSLGNTGLHYLAIWNNVEAAKIVLASSKCDIDRQNNRGNTALYEASRFSSLEMIRLLLDEGASYSTVNSEGLSPLSFTTKEVRKTFRKFARDNNLDDPELLSATETRRHIEKIESSDDVYGMSDSNNLDGGRLSGMSREERKLQQMLAIFSRSTSSGGIGKTEAPGTKRRGRPPQRALGVTTDEDFSPPQRSKKGPPLRKHISQTLPTTRKTVKSDHTPMIDKATGRTRLHKMAARGKLEEVKDCLASDKSLVKRTDNAGYLAIHEACLRGNYDIVVTLLDAGSLLDAAANNGDTPLHDAASNGHAAIVEVLLKRGANPSLENEDGLKPVDLCPDNATLEFFRQHESTFRGRPKNPLKVTSLESDADSDYSGSRRRSNRITKPLGNGESKENSTGQRTRSLPPPTLVEIVSSEPLVQLHCEGGSDDETGWYFLGPQVDSLHQRYVSAGKLSRLIPGEKQRELSFDEAERLQGSALVDRLSSLSVYFKSGSPLLDKDAVLETFERGGFCLANVPVVYVDMARLSFRRPSAEDSGGHVPPKIKMKLKRKSGQVS